MLYWLVAEGHRLAPTVGGRDGPAFIREDVSRESVATTIELIDVTRNDDGEQFVLRLDDTTVTAETGNNKRIVIEGPETEIEVFLAHDGLKPSAVRIDGMSLWTS